MTTAMTRLSHRLPDFTRYSWASDKARSVWEPRIQQTLNCWTEIEWKSVAEGIRACTLTVVSPEELLNQAPVKAKFGLTVLPLGMQGASAQPYSNTETAYQPGAPFVYRAVIGTPHNAAEFHEAYQSGNQDAIGQLLGYPDCCRNFFQRVWVDENHIDTTWSMAINTEGMEQDGLVCKVVGDNKANILLRWLGIRSVPHLPCSFDCASTVEQATRYLDYGRQLGFETEMAWLEEMLSWPVEWSALHGIAEIKTPVARIASCTDATAKKYVVQRSGTSYPDESAQGLVFPYLQPDRRKITDSEGFKRGLEHPLTSPSASLNKPTCFFTDNGFSSLQAMQQCHQPILELVKQALNGEPATVLDLGCGNGALLKKIYEENEQVVPFGIDCDEARIGHAHDLHSEYRQNFMAGDIFYNDQLWGEGRSYSLVIFMPGRLLEVQPEQKEYLLRQLRSCSEKVLVYAYDDWLAKYGGLAALAEQAGLKLMSNAPDLKAGLAVINAISDC